MAIQQKSLASRHSSPKIGARMHVCGRSRPPPLSSALAPFENESLITLPDSAGCGDLRCMAQREGGTNSFTSMAWCPGIHRRYFCLDTRGSLERHACANKGATHAARLLVTSIHCIRAVGEIPLNPFQIGQMRTACERVQHASRNHVRYIQCATWLSPSLQLLSTSDGATGGLAGRGGAIAGLDVDAVAGGTL
jgi:hypothetical protein